MNRVTSYRCKVFDYGSPSSHQTGQPRSELRPTFSHETESSDRRCCL